MVLAGTPKSQGLSSFAALNLLQIGNKMSTILRQTHVGCSRRLQPPPIYIDPETLLVATRCHKAIAHGCRRLRTDASTELACTYEHVRHGQNMGLMGYGHPSNGILVGIMNSF
jgi:hypothetical protein